jgi:hypothetical protein
VKPHAKRNIQLQCAEFVPVRSARRAIRGEEDERGRTYSRVGHKTIIPSKLNGKSENYLPPRHQFTLKAQQMPAKRVIIFGCNALYGGWSCCGKQFLRYWRR